MLRQSQPEIACLSRACRDDQVRVLGLTRYREVRLDATPLVEPLRIHDLADRHLNVIGADASEHRRRIAALQHELGERRLVEQPDPFTDRLVLAGRLLEPVLATVAVHVARLRTRRREPVGALEARRLAEARPGCSEAVVQSGLAHPARCLGLPEWPMHRIQQPSASTVRSRR